MNDANELLAHLRGLGVNFATGVPDSLLAPLSHAIEATADLKHVAAPNEGVALSLAMGHWLADGGVPLVYMQNSGLGNVINPYLSLTHQEVYAIPTLLAIGWRGEIPGKDEPQHQVQGRLTKAILDAVEIPTVHLERGCDAKAVFEEAIASARKNSSPSAVLVSAGALEVASIHPSKFSASVLSRFQAIEALRQALPRSTVVVSTTGKASRELETLESGDSLHQVFLTVGGMGHASAIALGLKIAMPEETVVCLDGDGALQMHMGSIAMIGQCSPPKFLHVLVSNGVHDSVGGQAITNTSMDYVGLALSCGYESARVVRDTLALQEAVVEALATNGPHLVVIEVAPGADAKLGRPTSSPMERRDSFITALQGIETR